MTIDLVRLVELEELLGRRGLSCGFEKDSGVGVEGRVRRTSRWSASRGGRRGKTRSSARVAGSIQGGRLARKSCDGVRVRKRKIHGMGTLGRVGRGPWVCRLNWLGS